MLGNVGADALCKTERISLSPYIFLKGDDCSHWCFQNNVQYVTFLNNNIAEIKDTLFNDAETIILMLNPINSNTGNCVPDYDNWTHHCQCHANYQIMVSREFYNSFLHIMEENLRRDQRLEIEEETIRREEFSALAILLKFYPRTAIFYLAYLFYKYKDPSAEPLQQLQFELNAIDLNLVLVTTSDNDVPMHMFTCTPVGYITKGLTIPYDNSYCGVDDKGKLLGNEIYERILFMNMYEKIVMGRCNNLHSVGAMYFASFSEKFLSSNFANIAHTLLSILPSFNN